MRGGVWRCYMNIIIVNLSDEKLLMHEKGELPLGPACLASYTKKFFPDCYFSIIVGLPSAQLILKENPDILCISSVTDNFTHAKEFVIKFRKISNIPIIIGGHHISYLPNVMPKEADVGVLFEGEETFLELIKIFDKYGKLPAHRLKNIDGIVFWYNGKLQMTNRRASITNLDSVPFPDRSCIKYMHKKKILYHIMTSRGCPNKCSFCSSSAFWKNVRYFSPEYVVSEMEHLINRYKVTNLHIYDDLWLANKKRFFKIAELIEQRGLNKKTSFMSWVTARTLTPEVASVLVKLNFTSIMIGFESGSEPILRYLKGRSASIHENEYAIKTAKKAGLKIGGTFMLGIPGETVDDIFLTKGFIENNELDFANIFLLKPLPGTKIWDYALNEGLVNNNLPDWGILNNDDIFSPNAILLNREITPKTLNNLKLEIQEVIDKKRTKSLLTELFSRKTDWRFWVQYLKRAAERPDLMLTYVKKLLS